MGRLHIVSTAAEVVHGAAIFALSAEDYAAMDQILTRMENPSPLEQLPLTRTLPFRVRGDHGPWGIRRPDRTVIPVEGRAQSILLHEDRVGAVLMLWLRPDEDARLPAS